MFVSALVLAMIIACWLLFERRKLSAQEISLIAALSAIAALSRLPFAGIPGVQPTTFFVILGGAVFGPFAGGAIGALAALVSNVFLGQGPWTPLQMLAWGLAGVSAGGLLRLFPHCGRLRLSAFGFVWGYLFGWLMNLWYWWSFADPRTLASLLLINGASFWFDTLHAVTNTVLFLGFGREALSILRRFQRRLSSAVSESKTDGIGGNDSLYRSVKT